MQRYTGQTTVDEYFVQPTAKYPRLCSTSGKAKYVNKTLNDTGFSSLKLCF